MFRGGRGNVRNIAWLAVALDKPQCASEESLTQLENTGQQFVYVYTLFKICGAQKLVVYRIHLSQQNATINYQGN